LASIGKDIQAAKRFLTEGELVAIPTETVYGLAGNALNPTAVLSIFDVKNRPSFDPLIIHTDSLEKLEAWVEYFPTQALQLANSFWPGPLTLLLPKKKIIPDLVTSGLDTVAVRIPDHALTTALLSELDFPLAAPSANPFGYISPTNSQHVNDQLGEKIPYILDGGECNVGVESTIIGFENEVPTVYRLGGLALEEIIAVVGEVNLLAHSTSNPQAPGMLKSHYAPRKLLQLKSKDEMIERRDADSIGYLFFEKPAIEMAGATMRVLSETGDLKEAAHHLFAYLRELDTLDIEEIWAETVPEVDLGRAINDRLRRAAAR
jgi:L-threonylcarbamoyladenylate synthase